MLSRLMTTREQLLVGSLAAAIFVGAVVIARQNSAPNSPEAAVEIGGTSAESRKFSIPPPSIPPRLPAPDIGVAAMGAVRDEGLYFLPADARVKDLIKAAGGAAEDADLGDLNLAAHLMDTSTLTVPKMDAGTRPPNPPQYTISKAPLPGETPVFRGNASAVTVQQRVNLNTATSAQLETLPGIGPATAAKIIGYRRRAPFRRIEDLEKVSGIGPAKMREIQPLVRVR